MSHHKVVRARVRDPPDTRSDCMRLTLSPSTYGLACCSWPRDRWAAKLTNPGATTSGPGGAIVSKLRKMKMATPAVHANAWFCLAMAVGMLLVIPTPRLDPVWLMIVVLIIGWICYLGRK